MEQRPPVPREELVQCGSIMFQYEILFGIKGLLMFLWLVHSSDGSPITYLLTARTSSSYAKGLFEADPISWQISQDCIPLRQGPSSGTRAPALPTWAIYRTGSQSIRGGPPADRLRSRFRVQPMQPHVQ